MTQRKLFNKHHGDAPPNAVYIGRGSKWGNPFPIGTAGTRDEVCDKFEKQLGMKYESLKEDLINLHGKPLVCFCYPKRCHGETLIKLAERAHDELKADPLAFS